MPALRVAAFAARGAAEDEKPDTIEKVYKSLQLSPGEVAGDGPFKPGDKLKVRFSLTNKTSEDLRPPPYNLGKRSVPVIGLQQAWIERLGENKTIAAIPKTAGREGAKYAAGGTIIVTPDTIKGRDKVDLRVSDTDTTGYPPGKYKVTLQYKALNFSTVLQTKTVEFELGK